MKNCTAYYGTQTLTTQFARPRQRSLSSARRLQSTNSNIIFLRLSLMLSPDPCLGLLRGVLPSGFRTSLISPICPANLIMLHLTVLLMPVEKCPLWISRLHSSQQLRFLLKSKLVFRLLGRSK